MQKRERLTTGFRSQVTRGKTKSNFQLALHLPGFGLVMETHIAAGLQQQTIYMRRSIFHGSRKCFEKAKIKI